MNLIKAQHLEPTTKLSKSIGGFNPLETIVELSPAPWAGHFYQQGQTFMFSLAFRYQSS